MLKEYLRIRLWALAGSALIGLCTACTVQLISPYDEQTDKSVTALQRKVETFFVKLEGLQVSPECRYNNNKTFYEESKVDISAIQVRAVAIPKNDVTSEQIQLLSKSLDALEKIHSGKLATKGDAKTKGNGCMDPAELAADRQAFNSSFTAILKLEIAKKRGESK